MTAVLWFLVGLAIGLALAGLVGLFLVGMTAGSGFSS